MFPDIEKIRKTRKRYNMQMYRSVMPAFRKIEETEETALKTGVLDRKYKELVALGISISKACYG
jgi:hypothetical protein